MKAPGKVTFHPTTDDPKGVGYHTDTFGRICDKQGTPFRNKRERNVRGS